MSLLRHESVRLEVTVGNLCHNMIKDFLLRWATFQSKELTEVWINPRDITQRQLNACTFVYVIRTGLPDRWTDRRDG